jgi:hypothetical protein
MRPSGILLIVSMALAVLGVGVSYAGYDVTSETVTLTTTQMTSVLSTIATRTITKSSVVPNTIASVHETFSMPGRSGSSCYWKFVTMPVKPGELHVAYTSTDKIRFIFGIQPTDDLSGLNEYLGRYDSEYFLCNPGYLALYYELDTASPHYTFTDYVPSGGVAVMVFMNGEDSSTTVTADMWEENFPPTQVTVTQYSTLWTTKLVPTQVVMTRTSTIAGGWSSATLLAPSPYLAAFYVVLAGAAIAAILLWKRKRSAQPQAPKEAVTEAVAPVAPMSPVPKPQTVELAETPPTVKPNRTVTKELLTKFCRHCGARISRDSTFCQESGKEVGGQAQTS